MIRFPRGDGKPKAGRVPSTSPAQAGTGFLIFFGLFWWAITGTFDVIIFSGLYRQAQTLWYKEAPAEIVRSQLRTNSDSEGTTYAVDIEYNYVVGDHIYTSKRYSFNDLNSSDSRGTRAAVRSHQAGSTAKCYYDPAKPSHSVIRKGLGGSDLFMVMFITPFNLGGVGVLAWLLYSAREKSWQPRPRIVDHIQNRELFCMSTWTPLGFFFSVFLLATFLGLFVVVIPNGFNPPLLKVGVVWGSAALLSIVLALRSFFKTKSGVYDLVFDHNVRSISLPAMHGRKQPESVPYDSVSKIEARAVHSGSGDDAKTEHFVNLLTTDGRDLRLKREFSESHADALARALNERIRP